MRIREIKLKNFGRFTDRTIRLQDGINVIYGENERGKTTLYTAIGALLFGLDKKRGRAAGCDSYATYQPWENRTRYEAAMKFETGGKCFYLERSFYHGEKNARLVCETDGEELDVSGGDLSVLLGDANAELFFNTVAVGQLQMKPKDIVYSYLKNYIAGVQEAGSSSTDVVRALEILSDKKRILDQEEKHRTANLKQEIERVEAKLELIRREQKDCEEQLQLKKQGSCEETRKTAKKTGLWSRLIQWMRRLIFGKRLRKEEEERSREALKTKERIHMLQEFLGEKESLREEFLLIREQLYEELQKKPKEAERQAILLAMERIQELSVVRREEVLEELLTKASAALCRITEGKYKKLILEEEALKLWDGQRMLKLFQVSAGCADQVYLSFRIALQDLFFEEETLPLIFDDAFVYFDDKRLEQLLGYLAGLERQVILLTCQKREAAILKKMGAVFGEICLDA